MRAGLASRLADIEPFRVMEILARARELERAGRSIVHMEIGEPDFPTPRPICEAGIGALEKGELHYTPAQGLPALREAIAQYEEALRLAPRSAAAHNNLATALLGAGRADEGIDLLRRALELAPDYEIARRNLDLALTARSAGDREESTLETTPPSD